MNNTLDQLKNTFLDYIRDQWDYTMRDINHDIANDYLTDYSTDDGRTFLHYFDGCFEFVITSDGVLDDKAVGFNDYVKCVY